MKTEEEGKCCITDHNRAPVFIPNPSLTTLEVAKLSLAINMHDILVEELGRAHRCIKTLYPNSTDGIRPEHMDEFLSVHGALTDWSELLCRINKQMSL